MHRRVGFVLTAALLSLGVFSCSTGGGGGGGGDRGQINLSVCPDTDPGLLSAEAVSLTNQRRANAGRAAVTLNAALTAAAQGHADAMADQGFSGHENPFTGTSVGDRVTAEGYAWSNVGEILAYGQCTADQAVDDWMSSTGHREIMLGEQYTEIGIGVRHGGDEEIYWVEVFAAPQ